MADAYYRDENGIPHPTENSPVSAWTNAHLIQCPICIWHFAGIPAIDDRPAWWGAGVIVMEARPHETADTEIPEG